MLCVLLPEERICTSPAISLETGDPRIHRVIEVRKVKNYIKHVKLLKQHCICSVHMKADTKKRY